jgi:hypothetical protein
MSGIYSNIRGADVSIDDIEIFLQYQPNRDVIGNTTLTKLNPSDILSKVDNPNKTSVGFEAFGGLYTLTLPKTTFGLKGIYTLIIKPIEIRTRIVDCGVLSAFPDIKGLVFDTAAMDSKFISRFENNGLVGYRIEYLSTDSNSPNTKISNLCRIITSNNKAEPVNQNLTNSNQKAIRYRFNDNSSLIFCTLTPSSASNVKPNALPFIGQPNQEVIITNTFFNPQMIEIEMVEYDVESLAVGLFGNLSKSVDDGILTMYNFNNQIYKQYNIFEIRDKFTGKPLFEVREQRTAIDFNKNFGDITNV